MKEVFTLKQLEKKAFRAAHQDGLQDIYIAGVVMSMAVLAYSNGDEAFPLPRFVLFMLGLALSYLVFWAGKKYITTPRLGQVKFGPQRQKRKLTLVIVLAVIVAFQVIILIATVLLWINPPSGHGLAGIDQNLERLLVGVIGALFVGPSMAMIAYFTEYMRGYYIAFILSIAVFSLIWFGQPIFMIAAGFMILIPGVILFLRFLRLYRLPPTGVNHV